MVLKTLTTVIIGLSCTLLSPDKAEAGLFSCFRKCRPAAPAQPYCYNGYAYVYGNGYGAPTGTTPPNAPPTATYSGDGVDTGKLKGEVDELKTKVNTINQKLGLP